MGDSSSSDVVRVAGEQFGDWVGTSGGFSHHGHPVIQPHSDSHIVRPVTKRMQMPQSLLDYLEAILDIDSKASTYSFRSVWRSDGSPEQDYLERFVRDVELILSSTEYGRLGAIMQMLTGDSVHTRQSHSLEVARVAYRAAKQMGLNVPLVVAAALAHDIGHTMFGHSGEYGTSAVAGKIPEITGKRAVHGEMGAKDVLSNPYFGNLSSEVALIVWDHSWTSRSTGSPEGELISIADRHYVGSDVRDALIRGYIKYSDLPEAYAEICGVDIKDLRAGKYSPNQIEQMVADALVKDMVAVFDETGLVGLSPEFMVNFSIARKFNPKMILTPQRREWQNEISELTGDIIFHIADNKTFIKRCIAAGRLHDNSTYSDLSRAYRISLTFTDEDAFRYAETEMCPLDPTARRQWLAKIAELRKGLPVDLPHSRPGHESPGEPPRAPMSPPIPHALRQVSVTIPPTRANDGVRCLTMATPEALAALLALENALQGAKLDARRRYVIPVSLQEGRSLRLPGPAHSNFNATRQQLISALGKAIDDVFGAAHVDPDARSFLDRMGVSDLGRRPSDSSGASEWDSAVVAKMIESLSPSNGATQQPQSFGQDKPTLGGISLQMGGMVEGLG